MSGFTALAGQGVILLAAIAIVGIIVGWSFGSLRASRTTSERYEQQLRATLRRMSEAESDVVTLRANLQEIEGTISSQAREHDSREHLLAALEDRLAEAVGAVDEERRRADAADERHLESEVDSPIEVEDSTGVRNGAPNVGSNASASLESAAEPVVVDDDLTRIKGIGKVIEGRLKGVGITSFAQVAQMAESDQENLGIALGAFKNRVRRDGWAASAAELHRAEYGGDVAD